MILGSRPVDDPAADAGRFLCRIALIILMIVIPCAEVGSRLAIYSLLPVGAVVIIIAGLLAGVKNPLSQIVRILNSPLGLVALLLTLWAGLSLIWTPFPAEAAARFGKALGTQFVVLLAILYLPERTKPANLYLLPIGLTLAAAATIVLSLSGLFDFRQGIDPEATLAQRACMSLVMLVFPALGALSLRERWWLAAGLAVLVVAATLAAFIQVALAAFAIGALVYATALSFPSRVAKICAYSLAALVVLAPALALAAAYAISFLPHAAFADPLRIAAGLVAHEWPRLITGHGMDMATRAIDIGYLPPATPRSILFLLWYDLGILGALAFAFLTAGTFLVLGRMSPTYAAPFLGGIAAGWVVAASGAETTQIWWITLNGLNAIAFAIFAKSHMRRKRLTAASFDEAVHGSHESRT
jgi:hypothetical protein